MQVIIIISIHPSIHPSNAHDAAGNWQLAMVN
jgi:hypothetical protein